MSQNEEKGNVSAGREAAHLEASDRERARELVIKIRAALSVKAIGDAEGVVSLALAAAHRRGQEAAIAKLEKVADQCEAGGHTSRAKMFRAIAAELRALPSEESK